MILVKTAAGQALLAHRQGSLSPRQRSAFILFDGQRTVQQVLVMTAAMGITLDDVQTMLAQGLLVAREGGKPSVPKPAAPAEASAPAPVQEEKEAHSSEHRYKRGYPIAVELVGALGLKGFRLNLAVERAMGFSELAALAPKIREAVGATAYARLEQALFD